MIFPLLQNWRIFQENFQFYDRKIKTEQTELKEIKGPNVCHITGHQKPTVMGKHFKYLCQFSSLFHHWGHTNFSIIHVKALLLEHLTYHKNTDYGHPMKA